MANKRMFTMKIVDSDAFLDMPLSAQCLYFHLNMRADDDGFIGNPKRIMKIVGATDDDLKLLIAKSFLLTFENGVIVIKHWRMHNTLSKRRYHETQYIDEKGTLLIKKNGSYSLTSGEPINDSGLLGIFELNGEQTENKWRTNGEQMENADLDLDLGLDLALDQDRDLVLNTPPISPSKEGESGKGSVKKKEPVVYYPDDEMLDSAFKEFLTMRKQIKKPLATKQALTRMKNKIERISGGNSDLAIRILNQSTDNCWQDVYELKDGRHKRSFSNAGERDILNEWRNS